MDAKYTTRQEQFAYNVVHGMKIPDAYAKAGYKSKDIHNSYKTLRTEKVQEYVRIFQKDLQESILFVTKEQIISLWQEIIDDDTTNKSTKIRALTELGKLLGYYETKLNIKTEAQVPLFIVQTPKN